MADSTAAPQQQQDDLPFVFHMQIPVLEKGAHIVCQALDFGKPLKDTTRRLSVVAATEEQQRAADFQLALLDIVVTAINPKQLRTATHGLLENVELSMKTLQVFAPSTSGHITSSNTSSPLMAENGAMPSGSLLAPMPSSKLGGANPLVAAAASASGGGGHQHHPPQPMMMMGSKSSSSFDRSSSFASGGDSSRQHAVAQAHAVKQSPRLTAHEPTSIAPPPLFHQHNNLDADGSA